MDPNETLALIRQRVAQWLDTDMDRDEIVDAGYELAEAVRDLDEWLTRGGFPPASWDNAGQPLTRP